MKYGLRMYAGMLGDKARVSGYSQALARTIRPGCTVLDLGAGFGYFAVLACKLGAGHVYAIEPAESILLGKEVAEKNGCADRIDFIQGLSTGVTLPEPVDVLVCDLRGSTPLYARSLSTIIDARARLLKPEGVLLPWRDRLFVAPVDDRGIYMDACRPWQGSTVYDVDLGPVERRLVHDPLKRSCTRKTLLAEPRSWATLDYRTIESPNVAGRVELRIEQPGTIHGFASWFDAEIAEGICYSSGPSAPPTTYGQLFLPLATPVQVLPGDRVELSISAQCGADDYLWMWRVVVQRGSEVIARRDQSTFDADLLGLKELKRSAPSFIPELNETGAAEVHALGAFGSGKSLVKIAAEVYERFPKLFPDEQSALAEVTRLSLRCSR